jgi:hypothetical protein
MHAISGSGAPTDGVTGAGQVEKGWAYIDDTTGNAYLNSGTRAAPVWNLIIT